MKRIIVILCICLLLTGCGTSYEDAENISETTDGGYFTLIKKWDDADGICRIVYANDTKVKYLIWENGYRGGITPLYNADGSLQTYKGE